MNILMFSRLYWPHGGGVEKHVEELTGELMKRGHKITLITEQYDLDLPLEEIHKGLKIFRIPFFAVGSKRLVWTWIGEHEQLINQADILHIHDVFWWYWMTRLFQLFKPVYITFHGYEGKNPPTWRAILQRKLAEIASSGSICVGDFMRKWYKASPNIVTYGAGYHSASGFAALSRNSAVFWGRFDEDTGVMMYVEAMDSLKRIKKLRIYGDGPQRELLEKSIASSKHISLFPWNRNMKTVLGNSRYAFVSRYLSILEAMQAKRLVVATYNNAIKRDYLLCHPMRDNMIIAGSSEELADKMNLVTEDKASRMVEKAYQWAKEQTWQKMADTYEQLWKV